MTQITWFARLVNSEGAAVAGVGVQLQLFDLAGGWKGIGDATTNADGRVKAVAEAPGGTSGPAPMLRLMETDAAPAVLGGVPTVSASGSPPALACDFGEIVHIPDRITFMRASPMRLNLRPAEAAGVAVPAAAARGGLADAIGGAAVRVDLSELQNRLASRDADVAKLQVERDAVASQLNVRATEAQKVQAERDDARNQLNTRETDVEKLRLERDQVKAQLVDSEKRLSDIRTAGIATAAANPDAPATRSFGAFATRLGGDIDSAQLALKNRGFSLGAVSVRTPVLVDKSQQVTMPDQDEIKALPKEAISEVTFGYHPTPEADAAGTGVAVPDIRQLTESAARRVLVSVGLGLEVSQGPPSLDPTCVEGQVMLQSPKAGETAPRGTRVLAIFSRKEI